MWFHPSHIRPWFLDVSGVFHIMGKGFVAQLVDAFSLVVAA